MPVRIRLQRHGAKHRPVYRVVVADSRSPRDGRFVEILGTYTPQAKRPEDELKLKVERAQYWLGVGAQPSDTAKSLIKRATKEDTARREAVESAITAEADAEEAAAKVNVAPVVEEAPVAEEAPVVEETPAAEEAAAEEAPEAAAEKAPAEETSETAQKIAEASEDGEAPADILRKPEEK